MSVTRGRAKENWRFTKALFHNIFHPAELALVPPDYGKSVDVVVAVFAVLTGIAITDYLASHDAPNWRDQVGIDFPIFVVLVVLLMRFVIGSAVHLNATYVKKNDADTTRSRSVLLLCKDLAFLVMFGWIGVHMAHAKEFAPFIQGAIWFLSAGLIWSVVDVLWRLFLSADSDWPKSAFWMIWAPLDLTQLLFTLAVRYWIYPGCSRGTTAITLAVGFVGFFIVDFVATIRATQTEVPPQPANPH